MAQFPLLLVGNGLRRYYFVHLSSLVFVWGLRYLPNRSSHLTTLGISLSLVRSLVMWFALALFHNTVGFLTSPASLCLLGTLLLAIRNSFVCYILFYSPLGFEPSSSESFPVSDHARQGRMKSARAHVEKSSSNTMPQPSQNHLRIPQPSAPLLPWAPPSPSPPNETGLAATIFDGHSTSAH